MLSVPTAFKQQAEASLRQTIEAEQRELEMLHGAVLEEAIQENTTQFEQQWEIQRQAMAVHMEEVVQRRMREQKRLLEQGAKRHAAKLQAEVDALRRRPPRAPAPRHGTRRLRFFRMR